MHTHAIFETVRNGPQVHALKIPSPETGQEQAEMSAWDRAITEVRKNGKATLPNGATLETRITPRGEELRVDGGNWQPATPRFWQNLGHPVHRAYDIN